MQRKRRGYLIILALIALALVVTLAVATESAKWAYRSRLKGDALFIIIENRNQQAFGADVDCRPVATGQTWRCRIGLNTLSEPTR